MDIVDVLLRFQYSEICICEDFLNEYVARYRVLYVLQLDTSVVVNANVMPARCHRPEILDLTKYSFIAVLQ